MHRVGQNRMYAPYMTVYLVISLPKLPYTHRVYMVLANPIHARTSFPAAHASCAVGLGPGVTTPAAPHPLIVACMNAGQ